MAAPGEKNDLLVGEDFILDPNVERHAHLDMMRAFAIMCVVIDHGPGVESKAYGIHNVLFTQEWVVQVLWMIGGISWSLSKSSLPIYILRLLAYVIIGVALNLLAWTCKGMEWQDDPAGVIDQLWFVIALVLYVLLTASIKPLLRQVAVTRFDAAESVRNKAVRAGMTSESLMEFSWTLTEIEHGGQLVGLDADERSAAYKFGGVLAAQYFLMLVLFGSGAWVDSSAMVAWIITNLGESSQPWTRGMEGRAFVGQLWSTFGVLLLFAAGAKLLQTPRLAPRLSWVLIAYVYLNHVLFLPLLFELYGGGADRFFVGLEFFIIGLVASSMGLKHAQYLKFCLDNYWIILLGANGMIWGPMWNRMMDEFGPCDIVTNSTSPSATEAADDVFVILVRARAAELMFVVLFLAAGHPSFSGSFVFPERAWPPLLRLWISRLGLALFLVHEAVHIVMPQPFNWIILFVVLPLAFLAPARGARAVESLAEEETELAHLAGPKGAASNGHDDVASS